MRSLDLDTIIDRERAWASSPAQPPAEELEAIMVRQLCGPWFVRWLWPVQTYAVRVLLRGLVRSRELAAQRLRSRQEGASPLARALNLTRDQNDMIVRQILRGATDEAILAALPGEASQTAMVGIAFARRAIKDREDREAQHRRDNPHVTEAMIAAGDVPVGWLPSTEASP